jgi:serralysin
MLRPFNQAEYLATYIDLQLAYGPNPAAAGWHRQTFGQAEGRSCGFDGLCYIASHSDLIDAYGADPTSGAMHWIS